MYMTCWIGPGAVTQLVIDPDRQLRSASAISVRSDPGDMIVLEALVSAAAGSTGRAIFPRLRTALLMGEELILSEDGFRFNATTPLESWMVDVTTSR